MSSAYLEKTYTNNGNRRTMTFSFWMKIAKLNTNMYPMSIYDSSTGYQADIRHSSANQLRMYATDTAGTARLHLLTNRVFRDTNAWYHIVWQVDTTQATESNRCKLYVNGVQETSFATETYPPQDTDLRWNGNNSADQGGVTQVAAINGGGDFDGQFAHFHFIDGTAYPASTFGETDSTTGIWKPKTAPSVTYGTNGFFLKFDNTANMGLDSSGAGNNFSTTGTIIQTKDTPTNVFAKWNYNSNYFAGFPMSNVNTTATSQASGAYTFVRSTLGFSKGKYYWEVKASAKSGGSDWFIIGISSKEATSATAELGNYENDYGYRGDTGKVRYNNAEVTFGNTYGVGDIIGVAVDYDNGKLYFSKNGTWQNSGDPTSGSTGTGAISIVTPPVADNATGFYFPAISFFDGTYTGTFQGNFGDGYFGTTAVSSAQNPDDGIGIFEYDVPAGYRALCTKSLNAQEYS